MTDYSTNPPAFPTDSEHQAAPHIMHFEGMTLRDYFAAAAMQGDWASLGPNEDRPESCFPKAARDYYRMADAMLAARKEAA